MQPPRALDDWVWQRVGGAQANGEDELDARAGFLSAVPWPDGGLLVLDGVRLRQFGADGAEQSRVGAKGRGPWELVSLASACRIAGDTIVAFDAGTRRLSVFAVDGIPLRLIDATAFGTVMPHTCLRAGTVLAQYRLAEPARQLTDDEAERSRTTEAARGSGGAGRPADRRAPWCEEAVPGHAGAIWLRTFDPNDAPDAEWAGVSPDGRLIGRFTVPRSTRVVLQAVTETGVWLLRRDGDDGHAVFEFRRFARTL